MTLTKKMAIGVLGSLIVIFAVTYCITLTNNRDFFVQQMNSNAQDTATSLGLSLSHTMPQHDRAMMISMVEALFDSGYFSSIEIRDMEDNLLVSRHLPAEKLTGPSWFTHFIHWNKTVQSAAIMKDWVQVGTVRVVSNAGYASHALWKNASNLVYLYLLCSSIALVLVFFFIRWLMNPLKKLTKQAQAICERQYPIETVIPKTLELRQVTLAMNQMVSHLKALFEDQVQQLDILRKRAYQDPLTQLGNRRFFLQQLVNLLTYEEEYAPGFIVLIALDGLDHVNRERGYQAGDKVILSLAEICSSFWFSVPGTDLGRISGSNFALIVREEEERQFMGNFIAFNELVQNLFSQELGCEVYVVTCPYFFQDVTSDLLKTLDKLLSKARGHKNNSAFSEALSTTHPMMLTDHSLETALANRHYEIFGQGVVTSKPEQYHQELYMRLYQEGGQQLRASRFMPIADKMGISSQIDQVMLKEVLCKNLLGEKNIAINLSEQTVVKDKYCHQYLKKLSNLSLDERGHLAIELKETTILNHFEKVKNFANLLHELSISFGVDQAGVRFTSMDYLHQLPIRYMKLHGCLTQDVEENQNKQFLLHYFNKMAKIVSIDVIVTRIETQGQWLILQDLGFIYGQGNFLDAGKVIMDHQ